MENLAMAWIDNKKVYGIVPQEIHFIEETVKTWRVELTAGGRSLAETKIQRGIFLGDSL